MMVCNTYLLLDWNFVAPETTLDNAGDSKIQNQLTAFLDSCYNFKIMYTVIGEIKKVIVLLETTKLRIFTKFSHCVWSKLTFCKNKVLTGRL